jgi:hypothetical protein
MQMEQKTMDAILNCFATRGKGKGYLLAKCPKSGTPEAAAWQGLALAWNPYKASIFAIMIMSDENHAIHKQALAWAESNMQLRGLDRDRLALESLGVW